MPSYVTPKKNTAFICYVGLVSQANTKILDANPTLAAGDFKVSIDGGSFNNLATLPTVTPAAGTAVKISLSTSEMNGDNIVVACIDPDSEWCDLFINIQTTAGQIDEIVLVDTVTTTTTATNLTNAPTAGDLTATMKTSVTTAATAATPTAAAVTGAVGSVTGNLGGNVLGTIADLNTAQAEPTAVPAANATVLQKLAFMAALLRNKITVTATTQLLRNDGDAATIATSTVSDDGTTFTRGKMT